MEKEVNIAVVLIRAYKVSQQQGLLALREFDFKFEELKWMADKMFDLLHKNIHISQAYEILQNYGKDFKEESVHKLIVNGLMCIFDGQNINYLIELLASILEANNRDKFMEEIKGIIKNDTDIIAEIKKKYLKKKPFSINTDIPLESLPSGTKIKAALEKMTGKEIKGILIGMSGDSAKKVMDLVDEYELKLIDEESHEDIDEQYIINAKNKFIACINE